MDLTGFDDLASVGRLLLTETNAVKAHDNFNIWVQRVEQWLRIQVPNTGLSAEWISISSSNLVRGNEYDSDYASIAIFKFAVQHRLSWLSRLPTRFNIHKPMTPVKIQEAAITAGRKEVKLQTIARAYVDPDRIAELKNLSNGSFDLTKLVRLCEELNVCFAGECYLAITMITRAILDHVPPIFSCAKFAELANNYKGAKSFKESMLNLENSSRKIADQHLHVQMRGSESLPTIRQVDFSNDLDVLLAEIVRLLKPLQKDNLRPAV